MSQKSKSLKVLKSELQLLSTFDFQLSTSMQTEFVC